MLVVLREGRRKLSSPDRLWGKLVPQLQSQVPGPLCHDLPGFLSPDGVRTPAVWFLLKVFILKRGFKGAAVQVKGNHVRGSESVLGKVGQEEFIDDSIPDEADLALLFRVGRGWVSRHDDANERSIRREALAWTVVECTAHPAFRTAQVLIGRQA